MNQIDFLGVFGIALSLGLACDVGENDLGDELTSDSAGESDSASGSDSDSDSDSAGDASGSGSGSGSDSGDPPGMCEPGDVMPAGDGCNTCTCDDDGSAWLCTEIACSECNDGDVMPVEGACSECECTDGSWNCPESCGECTPGDEIPAADGCNTCTCDAEGLWACTDMACGGGDPFDGPEVETCEASVPFDAVSVTAVTLEGDTLTVDVAYSGGCAVHLLGGCWDGEWAESAPVQTGITIAHDDPDDPCDAFPQDQVVLDLTPIRNAHADVYGPGPATVHVNLTGWPDTIVYDF